MSERITRGVLKGALLLLGLFLFYALMIPGGHPPEAGYRSQCKNNLRQIGWALENYHFAHGRFPPAYIADESGRPIHSWRILILPYFEKREMPTDDLLKLYDQYRLDEPWNGPNNTLLHDRVLQVFNCPSETTKLRSKHATNTNYVALIGSETLWPGEKAVQRSDIDDGPSNTLMVVESRDSGIHWMEPRDLHVLQMSSVINSSAGQGISSNHQHGAFGVLANSSVRFFRDELPEKTLRALLTIKGQEPLPDGEF